MGHGLTELKKIKMLFINLTRKLGQTNAGGKQNSKDENKTSKQPEKETPISGKKVCTTLSSCHLHHS